MEKLDGKSRFVIELKLYGDYSSIEEIKKELEIQVEELQYRIFDAEEPNHVIYKNENEIEEISLFVYFYSDSDLEWINQDFLEFSENFNGLILVTDFDNLLYQAYECGEYETGMFSQPEEKISYENGIKRENDNQGFPLMLK